MLHYLRVSDSTHGASQSAGPQFKSGKVHNSSSTTYSNVLASKV